MKKIIFVLLLAMFAFGKDQDWKKVESYKLKSIGYDYTASTLYVVTSDNDTLIYKNIKRGVYIKFKRADDKDAYFYKYVKKN